MTEGDNVISENVELIMLGRNDFHLWFGKKGVIIINDLLFHSIQGDNKLLMFI